MKQLHAEWGERVRFVDIAARQAHPGPGAPPYRSYQEKMQDAVRYERDEELPWPLLVDDLEGTVHQAYGGLADPTYLIDIDGRVSFYNMWTYVPALHQALEALEAQGWRGVVNGGIHCVPQLLPALTAGWRGLERGLPQSYTDLEKASPGAATLTWLGYQLRPVLAPLTQRSRPLPSALKAGLGVGVAALAAFAVVRALRDRSS